MEFPLASFKKELGEYCAVCEYVELAMRSMKKDHAGDLESADALMAFSKENNIYLATYDSSLLTSAVPQYYILNVYRCFEAYLKKVYRLIREYEEDGTACDKQEDSYLDCIDKRLRNRLSSDTRNLYNICSYYRLIRNYAAHNGAEKEQSQRRTAFQRIDCEKCALDAMFSKLNAPNFDDNICFDDFVLFSRSSIKLAEAYWKSLRLDYVSLIDELPIEIIQKWKGHQNNDDRLRREIKHFLQVNYSMNQADCSNEILNAVKKRF